MNYNRQVEYTEISAHNDAFLAEWLEVEQGKVYVGNDALRINPQLPYKLLWPLQRGTFNSRDYRHAREVANDLEVLWRRAIECELKIPASEFSRYCIVLVVPDSWDRAEIKACINALLGSQHPFRAVTILQESQGITFGSGVSSALVVNCGAQSVSVSCVDEGFVVPESRVKLSFGGDEVTRLFARLLEAHEFPYEFDLKSPNDWSLLDELKERCCTLNEAELGQAAQVFELYVRHPEQLTRQFMFKMFEERLIAPLAMLESGASWLVQQGSFEDEGIEVDAFDCDDPFSGIIEGGGSEDSATTDKASSEAAAAAAQAAQSNDSSAVNLEEEQVVCQFDGCNESFGSLKDVIEHLESVHDLSANGCAFPKCKYTGNGISLLCHIVQVHLVKKSASSEPAVSTVKEVQQSSTKRIGQVISTPLSVDEAAFQSLLQLADSDRIKHCAGSIILAGGSQLTPGFAEVFLSVLMPKFPLNPLTALTEVKLFPNVRDLDARFLAWKGGAVHAKLESTGETWVSTEDWASFGMRAVKEKIPFIQ